MLSSVFIVENQDFAVSRDRFWLADLQISHFIFCCTSSRQFYCKSIACPQESWLAWWRVVCRLSFKQSQWRALPIRIEKQLFW